MNDWQAEREQKVKELGDKIIAGVNQIKTTKEWAEMLSFHKGFWNYSFTNRILIYLQTKGMATQVASFKLWQKKGYPVKKGEKAIRVFAPLRKKCIDKETGIEDYYIYGFKAVPVFDVSQTSLGKIPTVYKEANGNDEPSLMIAEKVKTLDFVSLEDTGKSYGSYSPSKGTIKLRENLEGNALSGTFIHEFCHKTVHEPLAGKIEKLDYASEEIVVESAAYMICTLAGIDIEESSFSYVACWLANGQKKDDEIKNKLHAIEMVVNEATKGLKALGINLVPEQEKAEVEA